MQITNGSIAGKVVIFDSIIDEIPGGAGLNVTRLDYLTAGKEYIEAGTPVYYDPATRVAEVCKSVKGVDGGTTTALRVSKKHHFKVYDWLNDGTTGAMITAINTSNAAYDVLTVNTALLSGAQYSYVEGTVSGTSAAVKYSPNGLIKDSVYIKNGNADVSIVTMGVAREAALTYPLSSVYKIALRGGTAGTGTSLITVN